jgi:hypothetical protein
MSIEAKPPANALPNEDPYAVMKGGYFVAVGVSAVGFVAACRLMLWAPHAPGAWAHFAGCGMIGAATAVAFVWISQYYTDTKVREGTRVAARAVFGRLAKAWRQTTRSNPQPTTPPLRSTQPSTRPSAASPRPRSPATRRT